MGAGTDAGPGNEVKKRIVTFYKADLESSRERLEQWKNGKVSAAERRWLFTHWLAKAWKDYTTNCQDQITSAFKRCVQFNNVHGRENHLVKIQCVPDYEHPKKNDPWMVDPLKNWQKEAEKDTTKTKGKKAEEILNIF